MNECKTNESYQVIFDINSIKSILDDGWYIYLNPEGYNNMKEMIEKLSRNYKTFSLTGHFNVGKTWIVNQLARTNGQSGDTNHTAGISIFKRDRTIFLDTCGTGNPVYNTRE